jgi:hypothetical protein
VISGDEEPTVLIRSLTLSSPWRGTVAIVGAYAIAVQLVLSGVLAIPAAAWAAGPAGAICLHADTTTRDASGDPSDNAPICPHCGPGCVLAGVALIADPSLLTKWQPTVVATKFCARRFGASSRRVACGPHNARAPPA